MSRKDESAKACAQAVCVALATTSLSVMSSSNWAWDVRTTTPKKGGNVENDGGKLRFKSLLKFKNAIHIKLE